MHHVDQWIETLGELKCGAEKFMINAPLSFVVLRKWHIESYCYLCALVVT